MPLASEGRRRPAEHGVHAERLEEVRGREDALEPLRLTRPGEVHRRAREGGHARERRSPLPPFPEITRRDLDARVAALRLVLPDTHQAIGLGKRQRPDQHVVGDREHRGRGADAERRDGQRRRGEGPRAAERADASRRSWRSRSTCTRAASPSVCAIVTAQSARTRSEPCGIAPPPREDRGHLRRRTRCGTSAGTNGAGGRRFASSLPRQQAAGACESHERGEPRCFGARRRAAGRREAIVPAPLVVELRSGTFAPVPRSAPARAGAGSTGTRCRR